MSEILSNTGVKLWSETDYNELWLTVFDQLTGQGGKSNIRLIDEAIGKINTTLDGYKFEFSSDEDRLYISKGDLKLPVSLIDSNGHVASKVDGTTITIDESGVVKGIPVDDALSEESTNPLQNKVIASELKSIKSKMGTDESIIRNNTNRIEANETAISTLNGTGDGSVKKAVSDGIAEVVAGAPEDFDTLKEMSDWISSHENDASAMNSAIKDNKSAITALQTDKADKTEIPTVPTNVSEFINDAGYLTEHQDISNLVVKEEGKELSSNDYTSEEKDKLGGVGTSQGRNLIPCPSTNRTTNGITYTVQSDGSVLANGTASAENNAYYNFAYKTLKLDDTSYTLSCEGLPKSVYVYVYDETISKAVANVSDTPVTKTFVGDSTHTYSLSINVGKGTSVSDLAIKPILEMGTIAHAYEPISESNVNLKDAIDKVSTSQGKNIIPYPYSQTTKTVYGVTFTDNKDGSIGISGTQDGSTSRPYMGVGIWWGTDKKVGNIKIDANTYFTISSNCGSDNAGIRYYVYDESGSKLADNVVYGTETKTLKFDVDTWVALCIETAANSETYDCICKPQLELGAIAHSYEPTTISNTTLGKKLDSFKQYKPDGTTITADEDGTLHGVAEITVDDALSSTSTNPVQNKVVDAAIVKKADTILYDKSVSTLYLKSGSTVLSSTEIKSGGGATITPKPTVNPQIKNDDKKVVITWEDPTNTVIEGSTFSTWAGTKLVMKESGYPTSPDDGTLLVDNTARDKYKTTGFAKTGLTNDKVYYFALFPYSTDGVCNYDSGNRLLGEPTELKIVTFADGTDEEIAKMIQAHYANKINISDYWAVGDTRTVSLSAMSATGVGESHRAQTVQFVIGDFDHDDLATAINGHAKAAVTLLQKDCLMDASNASNPVNGSGNTENGYMNSTNTNTNGWRACARRTWCNNVYFAALPTAWQSMVKEVNKRTSAGDGSAVNVTVQDKIFLASEIEIFGTTTYSFAGEGTQYQYYKNATANRYKMPKWTSSNVSNIYWERSPYSGNTTDFCNVSNYGNANSNDANNAYGVAPCLCI